MCKIKTHGNDLALKLDDVIRMCFENSNGLPTSKSVCHSDKVNTIRLLWKKLNADSISLVETQIKPSFLTNKDSLHTTMFKNQPVTSMISNNKNELTGRRQQGGVMVAVKGEFPRM